MISCLTWIAEIAIPFSTLRFNDGAEKLRFNCYRYDTQLNEVSTWTNIPRNLIIANVGYMGDMRSECFSCFAREANPECSRLAGQSRISLDADRFPCGLGGDRQALRDNFRMRGIC